MAVTKDGQPRVSECPICHRPRGDGWKSITKHIRNAHGTTEDE